MTMEFPAAFEKEILVYNDNRSNSLERDTFMLIGLTADGIWYDTTGRDPKKTRLQRVESLWIDLLGSDVAILMMGGVDGDVDDA